MYNTSNALIAITYHTKCRPVYITSNHSILHSQELGNFMHDLISYLIYKAV